MNNPVRKQPPMNTVHKYPYTRYTHNKPQMCNTIVTVLYTKFITFIFKYILSCTPRDSAGNITAYTVTNTIVLKAWWWPRRVETCRSVDSCIIKYCTTLLYNEDLIKNTITCYITGWKTPYIIWLAQSIDMVINTAMCQQNDTSNYNDIWESDNSHKCAANLSKCYSRYPFLRTSHTT